MKKLFLAISGIILLFVGIVGLIMPILPGWLLIFAGLSLIAPKLAERLKKRIFRKFFKKDIVWLEEWKKQPVHAGFTTKHFPLVFHKTDDLLDPSNQEKFRNFFPGKKKFVLLNQVHEDKIVVLEDEAQFSKEVFYHFLKADAVITSVRDLTLLVMTADCLPVFFIAPGPNPWVGLAHAGWRGTQQQITKKTLELIVEKSKCLPQDVHIAFGPCIGKDQYEVGEEFKGLFPKKSLHFKHDKVYFNLSGENRRQLLEAGVLEKNILDHEICTVSENEDFYSFRKEKDAAGRMVSFITKL